MRGNPGRRVAFITLGCPKNEIDSELAVASIVRDGWKLVTDPESAEIIVINTCGFIQDAVSESIETILELARDTDAFIVVYGCLTARYRKELFDALPEVDLFIEGHDHKKLPTILSRIEKNSRRRRFVSNKAATLYQPSERFTFPGTSVYVKLAEGCNRRCSFCTIPAIRGRMKSRSIISVFSEIRMLIEEGGAKEIILVAQDTSTFGRDLGFKAGALPELLRKLETIQAEYWIRILYLHPAGITTDLIEILAESRKICRCLDVPFQHASPRILASMRRGHGRIRPERIAERLRRELPDWALRSSMIVGFPGETESDFEELLDFMREFRFERLGAFRFSPEEGTHAAGLPKQVPAGEVSRRFNELMLLQKQISRELNQGKIGCSLQVLATDEWTGRTELDAPEIDQTVHVDAGDMRPGEFNQVRIIDSTDYDLYGKLLDEV